MDVSKREAAPNLSSSDLSSSMELNENLEGENLIQTLVTLTGLPEEMAHDELDQILSMSGRSQDQRADLTLDELRAALITYLEALQPSCSE